MNNKKTIIALLLIAIIGIVGLTIAYFANSTSVDNTFITKEYGTTYEETFVSPDNWLPGDTTAKTLVATNTGEVDQAVRVLVTESWTTNNNGTLNGWIHADGTKSTHTTQSELETDERVAILNLANTEDWTKVGDYYYYNYKLAPTESTSSLLESVTFNPKTKLDDTCTETVNNGTRTITCNSSGNDYDNAIYTLTLTIETVQYSKYASAWDTGSTVNILNTKPMNMQQFVVSKTNPTNAVCNPETNGNMFEFSHAATSQTPAQIDYRYIGDNPNNYVYFNCDSTSDQSASTCEVWRILGVFDVDDGYGNVQKRMKLVRGSAFATTMVFNSSTNNNWTVSPLNTFLNGNYYNRTGNAATYGLKETARNLIDDAKYYIGAYNSAVGITSEQIYTWERGNTSCYSCADDLIAWTGKVGLMYPSDAYMVYGKCGNNACYTTPVNNSLCTSTIAKTSWIYNSNVLDGQLSIVNTWLLSSNTGRARSVYYEESNGPLSSKSTSDSLGIRPVVYLKSSVRILDGDGTFENPYKLY